MFMKLYLVQHAKPKGREENSARSLSEEGLENIRQIAKCADKHLRIEVEQIIHSGKLRAEQTAEILAEHLNPPNGVIADENLEPLDDPKVWKKRLDETTEDIMLVGHLPHLSRLTSSLLVCDEDREVIAFKMGGIVCLQRDQQRHWAIHWIVIPDAMP